MLVGLRYENAIPLETDDRAAAALVAGVAATSLVIASFLCLALWLSATRLAGVIGAPSLAPWLWLLPPCLLAWGLGTALSYWSIRQGTFRINGANRIIHYGSQAGGQLALGPLGVGSAGLILGYASGYVVRLVHLLLMLPRQEVRAFFRPPPSEIVAVLRRYWRFPVFSASASVLHTASAMLPAVLIAALYGPALAGFFALAQRVVGLPLRLLGESASHVFLGEIRNVDHAGLLQLFKRTVMLFAILGSIGMLPLLWFGPWLFAFIFGEAWRDAGNIIQLLLPLYLIRFVVAPISQSLNALGRQDLILSASILNIIALMMSFATGWWFEWSAYWTIALFSISTSFAFIFLIIVAWRTVRQAGRNSEAVPAAPSAKTS